MESLETMLKKAHDTGRISQIINAVNRVCSIKLARGRNQEEARELLKTVPLKIQEYEEACCELLKKFGKEPSSLVLGYRDTQQLVAHSLSEDPRIRGIANEVIRYFWEHVYKVKQNELQSQLWNDFVYEGEWENHRYSAAITKSHGGDPYCSPPSPPEEGKPSGLAVGFSHETPLVMAAYLSTEALRQRDNPNVFEPLIELIGDGLILHVALDIGKGKSYEVEVPITSPNGYASIGKDTKKLEVSNW